MRFIELRLARRVTLVGYLVSEVSASPVARTIAGMKPFIRTNIPCRESKAFLICQGQHQDEILHGSRVSLDVGLETVHLYMTSLLWA